MRTPRPYLLLGAVTLLHITVTPLPVSLFPNNVAPNVPDEIPRNPLFVILLHFQFSQKSSRDLNIFVISSLSLFEMIDVVVPEPINF